MELVHPDIEKYLYQLLPERDPVLREMESLGERMQFPLVGPLVGQFLYQLTLLTGAKRIFEMGSGFGYSAYWFAKALPERGEIILTEGSKELAQKAKDYLRRGGFEKKARFEVGDAIEILEETPGPFDLVFIDIDKEQYPEAFRKVLPKLRKGGILAADNVLWFGKVVDRRDRTAATEGIREFTKLIYESDGLVTTILPLRDGISVSVKV